LNQAKGTQGDWCWRLLLTQGKGERTRRRISAAAVESVWKKADFFDEFLELIGKEFQVGPMTKVV